MQQVHLAHGKQHQQQANGPMQKLLNHLDMG